MVAVTKQEAVPSMEFSTAKGNLEREQEVEDTMLELLQPFSQGLENDMHLLHLRQLEVTLRMKLSKKQSRDEKLSSVATDAGRRYRGKGYEE